jgi:hypothetical protein
MVTRSLAELTRLGTALGGKCETFHGAQRDGRFSGCLLQPLQPKPKSGRALGAGRVAEPDYRFDGHHCRRSSHHPKRLGTGRQDKDRNTDYSFGLLNSLRETAAHRSGEPLAIKGLKTGS